MSAAPLATYTETFKSHLSHTFVNFKIANDTYGGIGRVGMI